MNDEQIRTTNTARHPGDVMRLLLGVLVLFVALLGVQRDHLTRFEADLFRLINDLPSHFSYVLGAVMQLGNVLAAPAVALLALVLLRRAPRVAIDVTAAGLIAWFAAKAVKALVERPRPGGLIDDVNRIAGAEGIGFVSGHTAVAAAIATAAGPYLPRGLRRAVWALPWAVGLARIYYGAHLPLDIVGGAALGWALGAGLHLALGAPHRVPTPGDAAVALERAGVTAEKLERVTGTHLGSFPFVATVNDSTVFVKMLDTEPRDRDWLYRIGRFLAFRDVRDEAAIRGPEDSAHREAAMSLLARCHGARVPAIRRILMDGGRVWIVEDHVPGSALDRVPRPEVSDELLESVWEQLILVRDAGIAHRDLVPSNVLIDADRQPWIVDFAHAETTTRELAHDNDTAELLVTTASIAGVDRAVAAAQRVIGAEHLARAVPELQPLVLTAETRRRLRHDGDVLIQLRDRISSLTNDHLQTVTAPARLRHVWSLGAVVASSLALVALTAIAGNDVLDELANIRWRWIGVALVALAVTTGARASALLAALDRRLALGRTMLIRIAEQGCDTTGGQSRGRDVLVDHLERSGIAAAETQLALHRLRTVRCAVLAVSMLGTATAAGAAGAELRMPDRAAWIALVGLAALAVELSIGRDRDDGPESTVTDLGQLRPPSTAMLTFASLIEVAAGALVTASAVFAMGGGPPIAGVAALHVVLAAVTTAAPIRAAPGLASAVLVGGLAAIGTALPQAVAAAVAVQVLYAWLPAATGYIIRRVRVI